jgi:hypothetical protein
VSAVTLRKAALKVSNSARFWFSSLEAAPWPQGLQEFRKPPSAKLRRPSHACGGAGEGSTWPISMEAVTVKRDRTLLLVGSAIFGGRSSLPS